MIFFTLRLIKINVKSTKMNCNNGKKRKVLQHTINNIGEVMLPLECKKTIRKHVNSVYVASILLLSPVIVCSFSNFNL